MRNSEVADRAGKQPDGSAKTREAKVVTVWTAESRDNQGKPMRDPGSVTYSARLKVQPPGIPTRRGLTSPSACCAKRTGEASPKRYAARC